MAKDFTIRRSDGTEIKVAGYKFATPNPNVKKYAGKKYGDSELPAKVDLRQYMTRVENQGNTNSCVANAVAGAYEYLVKRYKGKDSYDVSRLFIYYNARKLQGWENKDEGSVIGDAIEGLKKWGACSEDTWPFDEGIVNKKPEKKAYEEAKSFLVEDVKLIPLTLHDWKHALAEGNPIIFGISLYESFDSHRRKGLVPMPSRKEASREDHGGHAMLCVGYSDADRTFIVRNSWGKSWGDKGYCYIPYDYLISEKFNDADSWIIKRLDNFPDGEQEGWGEEESVIEESNTEFSKMTDEEYTDMLDAMGPYHIEYRVALVLMRVMGINKSTTPAKLQELITSVDKLLTQLGINVNAEKLVMNSLNNVDNNDLLRESIGLLAKYLSQTILSQLSAGTLIAQLGLSQSTHDLIKYGLSELGGDSLITSAMDWLGNMFSDSVVKENKQLNTNSSSDNTDSSASSDETSENGDESSDEDATEEYDGEESEEEYEDDDGDDDDGDDDDGDDDDGDDDDGDDDDGDDDDGDDDDDGEDDEDDEGEEDDEEDDSDDDDDGDDDDDDDDGEDDDDGDDDGDDGEDDEKEEEKSSKNSSRKKSRW
jgi:hypothetical protein